MFSIVDSLLRRRRGGCSYVETPNTLSALIHVTTATVRQPTWVVLWQKSWILESWHSFQDWVSTRADCELWAGGKRNNRELLQRANFHTLKKKYKSVFELNTKCRINPRKICFGAIHSHSFFCANKFLIYVKISLSWSLDQQQHSESLKTSKFSMHNFGEEEIWWKSCSKEQSRE